MLSLLFSPRETHREKINFWYRMETCLLKISPYKTYFHYGKLGGIILVNSFGPLFPDWNHVPSKD